MSSLQTQSDQALESHSAEVKQLQDTIQKMKAEHEQALKKCEDTSSKRAEEVVKANGMNEFLTNKVKLLEDEKKNLEAETVAAESQKEQELHGQINDLEKKLETSVAMHQQTKDQAATCQSQLVEASDKIKAYKNAAEKAKQEASNSGGLVAKLHDQVNGLTKQGHQFLQESEQLKIKLEKVTQDLTECKNKAVTSDEQIKQLSGKVKDCGGNAEDAEKARHSAKEFETLAANLNKQLESTKVALQKAQQESDNARKEASKA